MAQITFQRNGNINYMGAIIGTWEKNDIWKQCNAIKGRDRSGNKLVHFTYAYTLVNGRSGNYCYTISELRTEVTDKFNADWQNILKAANNK